jgi:hypothetical protein
MAVGLTVVSTKLDPEILGELDYQCEVQTRNRSQTLLIALREWLDKQAEKPTKARKR